MGENKTHDLASALKRQADTSWESQERAIYTLEAMEKEFTALLSTSKEPIEKQED